MDLTLTTPRPKVHNATTTCRVWWSLTGTQDWLGKGSEASPQSGETEVLFPISLGASVRLPILSWICMGLAPSLPCSRSATTSVWSELGWWWGPQFPGDSTLKCTQTAHQNCHLTGNSEKRQIFLNYLIKAYGYCSPITALLISTLSLFPNTLCHQIRTCLFLSLKTLLPKY